MRESAVADAEGKLTLLAPVVPDAAIAELRATSARYAALLLAVEHVDAPVSPDSWCRLLVHGGMARQLLDEDGGIELLRTAVAARGGVCRGFAAPLLDEPGLQAAWAEALMAEAVEAPARLAIDADGAWTVDGTPVEGVGVTTVAVHPGLHRLEHRLPSGALLHLVEDVAPGETLGVWATDGMIALTPLTPGTVDWRVGSAPAPRSRADGPVVPVPVVEPGDPYVSVGASAGGGWVHGRPFAAAGLGFVADPGWRSGLGAETSLLLVQTAEPVFLSRWEEQSRLARIAVAGRWTILPESRSSPFVRAGGFVEPDVAIGPWVGAGATFRVGALAFDVGASAPLFIPARLGSAGVEALVEARWIAPLSRRSEVTP